MNDKSIDLSEIHFVYRHVVGSEGQSQPLDHEQVQKQMDRLNSLLKRGRIVNIEKNFTVVTRADTQIVMEYCAYHIGFKRKPSGL